MNPHFAMDDLDALHSAISRQPLGTLVCGTHELTAAHIPFVVHRHEGERGTLEAHTAKADPITQYIEREDEMLAIFLGPSEYISPRWYEGRRLPTYNFVAIHAYGRPVVMRSEDDIYRHLQELVANHEQRFDTPWDLESAPPGTVRKLLPHITPFRMEIRRLEGKFKLGQNSSAGDRAGVISGLREDADRRSTVLADLMERFPYPHDEARPLL